MSRIVALVATCNAAASALKIVPTPKVHAASSASLALARAAAITVPLTTALPALAVGEASDLDGLNTGLTVAVGLLFAFIAKNFADLGWQPHST